MYSLLKQTLQNKSFKPDCIVAIAPLIWLVVAPLIWLVVNMRIGVMGTKTDSTQQIPASVRFL